MQPVEHDPLQFGPDDTQVTSIDTATDTRHDTRDTCRHYLHLYHNAECSLAAAPAMQPVSLHSRNAIENRIMPLNITGHAWALCIALAIRFMTAQKLQAACRYTKPVPCL